ncbi:MAG: tRNA (adenosine(37)-N6)-dimethylallyltransferase MiaA [Termitinemataceae bacterium]|nr:MAG: tRNA (adenosine(37)-N6)-dimethylallyltransferase MiaA [Termitinemataceae bacterium]
MIPILILFGPTGAGKTELLRNFFCAKDKVCNAEVISADSMQVYRGLDIGTAKPSAELCRLLPHHLINVMDPLEQFSAGKFVEMAQNAAREIHARGALSVMSGGTGFYLKTFIEGMPFSPPSNPLIREQLQKELSETGNEKMMDMLRICDPLSAKRIHVNDTYRLLRALEVFRICGRPLSSFDCRNYLNKNEFKFKIYGLQWDRDKLYKRINLRCDQMFRDGLVEEVRSLFAKGFTPQMPAFKAIGYREFFIKNENDEWALSDKIDAVKDLVAQNSRHYAKRQITWFKKVQNVEWINGSCISDPSCCFSPIGLL